ncbi:MAG: FtsW/RodA/SpoVE family cell cycle protein [Candidatus Cloacimonadaceae bacterium]|nr:FtsW/RodA/SpoVE family cell cycle protein [Candidatus Cloacimonadaceae bacterium]
MKRNKAQNYIISYDKVIFFTYLTLCLIGILVMLDITSMQSSMNFFYRHVVFVALGVLTAILVLHYLNIEKLRVLNYPFVGFAILLLVIVLIQGNTVKGATRQLDLGFIGLQPSFIARMALVFFFAGYLDKKHNQLLESNPLDFLKHFYPMLTVAVATFTLIILERHLSTLVIGGLTLLTLLTYAGAKKRIVGILVLAAMLLGVVVITMGAEYRGNRIRTYMIYTQFLRNRPEPTNAAEEYQVKESLTALTSGGIFGTGIGRGRAKHYYLPEARTDYVYTIIGEEFGFIGAMIVFGLHCLLFFRAFRIANTQESRYLKFLCAGLAMNIFYNALVNTGVAMSILPATGNTLPFISYGGTALIIDSASVGVILNISAKRRQV